MEYISPSKDELLSSISPTMRLTKGFWGRIYGYGVTDASFPDMAIATLESAGCSRAREYYNGWVAEYERKSNAEIKRAAEWLRKEGQVRGLRAEEKKQRQQSSQERWEELSEALGFPSMRKER